MRLEIITTTLACDEPIDAVDEVEEIEGDELGRSWVAFTGEDPDGLEPTSVAIMCPACAAREFDWRPEAAADYT